MSDEPEFAEVHLVPVVVFGAEDGYGLMDAVQSWSDCNRARGHIFRLDEKETWPFRNPEDTITVFVEKSELLKFERNFEDE